MMEKKLASPAQRELFEKLIATHPEIQAKGKTTPYTSLNGNMFSTFSSQARFGLRLSQVDREAFIAKYDSCLLESHGTTMKEYVTVSDELLAKTKELSVYLNKSFEYAKSLKPKATAKKKK